MYLRIFILLLLLVIFAEDWKSRAVHWVLFPMLCLSLLALQYAEHRLTIAMGAIALMNAGFVLAQLLLVTLYFSIKNRHLTRITDGLIGWGDILFLFSITVFFSLLNFLAFYLLSLVLILLGWTCIRLLVNTQDKAIPLAGLQALLFTGLLSCDWWLKDLSLASDMHLLNFIIR